MIVKMMFQNTNEDSEQYERMVECDTIHKHGGENKLGLSLYKNGKLVESPTFKDAVQVFVMEAGKTIERFDFKMKDNEG